MLLIYKAEIRILNPAKHPLSLIKQTMHISSYIWKTGFRKKLFKKPAYRDTRTVAQDTMVNYLDVLRASPRVISKFVSYNDYVNCLYKFFANRWKKHSNKIMYNYVKLKLYIIALLVQQIFWIKHDYIYIFC